MSDSAPNTRYYFHRSWRSLWPQLFVAIVVSAVVAYVSLRYSFFALTVKIPLEGGPWAVELPLFLLVLGVMSIRPILLRFDDVYEVGEHHVYATSGRLSLHKERYEIPFEDIKGVRVRQSILQRILNVGDVVVWTALADKAEVVMHGLLHPEGPLRILRERIDRAIVEMSDRPNTYVERKVTS